MSGVIRSWHCQNQRCGHAFEAWEPNPHCPRCKCVRVGWIPGGGHVGGYSRSADVELRALADVFNLGDMNSAERGRGAKKVNLPPARSANGGNVHTFAGGFTAAIDPSQGAQCVPTSNKFDVKVKAAPGTALPPTNTFGADIRSNTVIESTHKAAVR